MEILEKKSDIYKVERNKMVVVSGKASDLWKL